jgi:hypothetical protein
MTKTGRPKTNGVHPVWMLLRTTIVVEAFHTAREAGEKYEFALEAAVNAVHAFDSTMKISVSVVKKILKEYLPAENEEMLKVTKIVEPVNNDTENSVNKSSYGVGFAPRVKYTHPAKRGK